jgi:hypothetical protein
VSTFRNGPKSFGPNSHLYWVWLVGKGSVSKREGTWLVKIFERIPFTPDISRLVPHPTPLWVTMEVNHSNEWKWKPLLYVVKVTHPSAIYSRGHELGGPYVCGSLLVPFLQASKSNRNSSSLDLFLLFVCSFESEHVPGGPWNHGPVFSSSMNWPLWDIKNPPNIVCVAKQGTLWHQNGPRKMEPYILPHTFQNLAQYDEKEININMYIWHMDMSLIYSP